MTLHVLPAPDVVRRLVAVQAQDYVASLWAIGLRTLRATQADVEQAVERRTIVRTWPMRRTLHFVAAEILRGRRDRGRGNECSRREQVSEPAKYHGAGGCKRHAALIPPTDEIERWSDDTNEMALVLTTEIGFNLAAIVWGRHW